MRNGTQKNLQMELLNWLEMNLNTQQKQTISGAFEQEWATLNDHSKIESFYKKNSANITMSQQLQIIHKLNKMQTSSTSKTDTQKAVSI